MSTIKDVQYSLNGEPLQKKKLGKNLSGLVTYPVEEIEDPKNKDKKIKRAVYPAEKKWHLFKLVDNNKKGGVRLSNVDDVMNPETGRVERIRLLSGVDSIWQKDQKDLPKGYENQNWVELRFFRGQKLMRVAGNNHTALEFIRMCNSNIGNPFRVKGSRHEFYEYDSSIAEVEAFERESFELEMAILAKAAKDEDMKKHAAFLGIRLLDNDGEKKSPAGIRKEYVVYAKRNPDYFKKTLDNPVQIEINWLVRRGISEAIIETGREPQKIYWANGGGMIGVYPQGADVVEYLTNLAMTNSKEGQTFKEQLQKAVT